MSAGIRSAILLTSLSIALCRAGEVCYDFVGCFNNSYPFNDLTNDFLPDSPDQIGTVFLLYTRRSTNEVLSYSNATALQYSAFNPQRPSKFIIHGFTQSETQQWMHDMKDALLNEGDFNVIIVGWKNGAKGPDYPKAVANTRVVGEQLALMVRLMIDHGANPQDVHLIGHSLGAHISGFAGSSLRGILGRISGLDPAGPSFKDKDTSARLDPLDAQFVDSIHTNGAPIVNGGAGMSDAVGNVDFYPNGGRRQPGCPDVVPGGISALLTSGFGGAGKVAACSHDRSVDLYIESISSKKCRFLSIQCQGDYEDFLSGACSSCGPAGCSEMGYNANKYPARGKMYLMTRESKDFCGYPAVVRVTSEDNGVVGALNLIVRSREGNFSIPVLSRKQRIPDNGLNTAVLFPVDLNAITDVGIMYSRSEGHLFGIGSGLKSWSLTRLSIEDPIGKKMSYCSTDEITTGGLTPLRLC